ncbi:MAG: hypothetical protein Q9160_004624 [Pyrenula sp. 1 TL-2023]
MPSSSGLAHEQHLDAESTVQRNPHPDFKSVEATRPPFSAPLSSSFHYTQVPNPDWTFGSGANSLSPSSPPQHRSIDPNSPTRAPHLNYKLLISAIVPRPIGFLSTRSPASESTNLAPFSYTQMMNHDPPIFVVGFASPGPSSPSSAKDTLRNLLSTRQASLNIVSESFLEAMNATAINAPHGVSEWALSGLTPLPCETIACSRVKESIFSVECELVETREWRSRREGQEGRVTGTMAVLEGKRFWVREDAVDEEGSLVDPGVLRPVARLGGITYATVREGMEVPRPQWREGEGVPEELRRAKVGGQ